MLSNRAFFPCSTHKKLYRIAEFVLPGLANMSAVVKLLKRLPDNEDTRVRVSEWLKKNGTDNEPEGGTGKLPAQDSGSPERSGSLPSSPGSAGHSSRGDKGPRVVSILKIGAGEVPLADPPSDSARSHAPYTGPTASRSGSSKGLTASRSGSPMNQPANSKANSKAKRDKTQGSNSSSASTRYERKRPSSSRAPEAKRHRGGTPSDSDLSDSESDSDSTTQFDPASLVKAKEGTFRPTSKMTKYLEKHFKRCLTKEEREAIFKEHPRPDTKVCSVPLPDKYITDFLGSKFPREQDTQDKKIQASVLAIARPLTSAWQSLQDAGLEEDTRLVIPAPEVLGILQRTLCLVGNASELISQKRRANILSSIDPSWSKFSSEKFTDKEMLFGEKFQSKLTGRIEKETALAKAVSISKRHKEKDTNPTRTAGRKNVQFF